MVIGKKTFSTLCYISRPNGLQNVLIADTTLAEPGPQPGFKFWRGKIHFLWGKDFNIYHMFETNFSEHNKIWGAQKRSGGN